MNIKLLIIKFALMAILFATTSLHGCAELMEGKVLTYGILDITDINPPVVTYYAHNLSENTIIDIEIVFESIDTEGNLYYQKESMDDIKAKVGVASLARLNIAGNTLKSVIIIDVTYNIEGKIK